MKYTSIHVFKIVELNDISLNSGLPLIFFNILVYLFISIALFSILLVFSDKTYSTLNKLKNLNEFQSIFIFTLFFLMSLAGLPPLLGFVGKFLLYIQLLAQKSFYLFIVFLIFNIFILYFYIQNIRFLLIKNNSKIRQTNNLFNYNYESLFSFLLFIMFFNIFGIFYFENILNYISFFFSLNLIV